MSNKFVRRLLWAFGIALALTPLHVVSDVEVRFSYVRCILLFVILAISFELVDFILSQNIPGLSFSGVQAKSATGQTKSTKDQNQLGVAGK